MKQICKTEEEEETNEICFVRHIQYANLYKYSILFSCFVVVAVICFVFLLF